MGHFQLVKDFIFCNNKLGNFVIECTESHYFYFFPIILNEKKLGILKKKTYAPVLLSIQLNECTFPSLSACTAGLLMHQASEHIANVQQLFSPQGFAGRRVDLLLPLGTPADSKEQNSILD